MNQIERICRECFWDYQVSPQDIKIRITRGSYEENKTTFQNPPQFNQ